MGENDNRRTRIEREDPAFREAMRLHDIENNPLSAEDIELFDMFHREGWSQEKRLAYLRERSSRSR